MASDSNSSPDSPPPSQWPRSLDHLLNSSTGKNVFLDYLRNEDEGLSVPMLFLLAIEGLHGVAEENDEDQMMVNSINLIYEELMPTVTCLSQHVKECIHREILSPSVGIYDAAADEVKEHLSQNLYPNFLKSDFYITAINEEYGIADAPAPGPVLALGGNCRQLSSATSELLFSAAKPGTSNPFAPCDLQTVHEEEVLSLKGTKLTGKSLLSTQRQRAKKGSGNGPHNPYHAQYSSYNPVSRQDSEIQSFSSGYTDESIGQCRNRPRRMHVINKTDGLRTVPQHVPVTNFVPKQQGDPKMVHQKQQEEQEKFTKELIKRLMVLSFLTPEERLPQRARCPYPKSPIPNHAQKQQTAPVCVYGPAIDKEILVTQLKKLGVSAAQAAGGGHGRLPVEEPELEAQDILDKHIDSVWKDSITPELNRSPRNEPNFVDSRHARRGHSPSSTVRPQPLATAINKGKSMMTLDSGLGGDKEYRYKVRPPLPKPRWTNEQFIDCVMGEPGKSSTWDVGHTSTDRSKSGDVQSRRVQPFPGQPIPHRRHSPPTEDNVSVFVHYESEHENPFLIKIPKTKLTLGFLKSKVPKKGNWKYLFKLMDADDRNKLINYELRRDEEILPMYHEECVVVILKSIHPPERSNVV